MPLAEAVSSKPTLGVSIPVHPAYVDAHSNIAPMLDAIDNDYQDVFWNGSLWYQSPYKGPPTPEVNQAWHDLMECTSPTLPIPFPHPY